MLPFNIEHIDIEVHSITLESTGQGKYNQINWIKPSPDFVYAV